MCSFQWKAIVAGALLLVAVIAPDEGFAQTKEMPGQNGGSRLWACLALAST